MGNRSPEPTPAECYEFRFHADVKTATNPGGLPKEVFDEFRAQVANNGSQFYRDAASGPFYGYNRPRAKGSEGISREPSVTLIGACRKEPLWVTVSARQDRMFETLSLVVVANGAAVEPPGPSGTLPILNMHIGFYKV